MNVENAKELLSGGGGAEHLETSSAEKEHNDPVNHPPHYTQDKTERRCMNIRKLTPGNGWTRCATQSVWEDRYGNRVIPQTNIGQILIRYASGEQQWIQTHEEPMRTALRRNGWNTRRAGLAVARLIFEKGDA